MPYLVLAYIARPAHARLLLHSVGCLNRQSPVTAPTQPVTRRRSLHFPLLPSSSLGAVRRPAAQRRPVDHLTRRPLCSLNPFLTSSPLPLPRPRILLSPSHHPSIEPRPGKICIAHHLSTSSPAVRSVPVSVDSAGFRSTPMSVDPAGSQPAPVDPVKDKENALSSPSKQVYWRRLAEKLLNNCWGHLLSWGTTKSGSVGVFMFVVETGFLVLGQHLIPNLPGLAQFCRTRHQVSCFG
jgi:hypothetical protein